MVEAVIVAALMAAIAAGIAVAEDARLRVTAVVDVLLRATAVAAGVRLRAMAVAEVAIRRRAADPRTVVGRHMAVDRRQVVAADMDGDTALDYLPV